MRRKANAIKKYLRKSTVEGKESRGITDLSDAERDILFKSRKIVKYTVLCNRIIVLVRQWLDTYERTCEDEKSTDYLINILWQRSVKIKNMRLLFDKLQETVMYIPIDEKEELEETHRDVDRTLDFLIRFQKHHLLDYLKLTPLYEYVKMHGSGVIEMFFKSIPGEKDGKDFDEKAVEAFNEFKAKVESEIESTEYIDRYREYISGIDSRFTALSKMDEEVKTQKYLVRKKEANDALDRFMSIFTSSYDDLKNDTLIGLDARHLRRRVDAEGGKIIMISKYYNGKCSCWYFKEGDNLTRSAASAAIFYQTNDLETAIKKLNKKENMAAAAVML